jgi:opacity protein-like surface antigen
MTRAGLLLVFLAYTGVASAQDQRFDFTITGAGVFSKTTRSNSGSVSNTPTKSLAYIGTLRYHFRPKQAFDVNVGRTSNSQIFSLAANSFRVTTSITEFSADYVLAPKSFGRFTPFALAGGGGLRFGVGNTYFNTFQVSLGATAQTSLAFLYGGGVDCEAWRSLSLRLQYRGLLFKQPDFGVPSFFFTGAKGHLAEPALGIVLKF